MPAITVFFICPCFKKQSKLLFKQMVQPATETGITAPESQAGSLKCLLLWRGAGKRNKKTIMRSILSGFAGDGTLTHFVSFGTNWAKWANWPRVTFETLRNRNAQYIRSFHLKTTQHVKCLFFLICVGTSEGFKSKLCISTPPPTTQKMCAIVWCYNINKSCYFVILSCCKAQF